MEGRALVEIFPLAQLANAEVEAILDAAFGADRQGRTAYRLRAGMAAISELSFGVAMDGETAGTVQCWPVAHLGDNGRVTPLVMVGPVAVLPQFQQLGLGRALMDAVMAAVPTQADGALMMIGDPEYYGRFFGFSADGTGAWRLPGPVEARRLLASPVDGHEVPGGAGTIGPRA
ncbi:MAG: N-acetyltransferase [Sphingopyxis sp.]|nr:N-acetyltransferase [Sphingopyxis sp.]